MTKDEKAEYQRNYYQLNKDKRQEDNRISYHKNKDKHKQQKKINNKMYYLKKKGITLQKQEDKQVTKRNFNIHQILDTLRKDLKHELWNKPVRKWDKNDWDKFNLL